MFDSVLPIIFSWPFVAFSLIATVVGILYEIPFLVILGAITIVPFSYQLNNVQYFRGVAFFLPGASAFFRLGAERGKKRLGLGFVCAYDCHHSLAVCYQLDHRIFLGRFTGDFMTSSTKLTRSLVDVAMGRAPADLVIRGGKWVCVQSGEIVPDTDIAIVNGHIAFVGRDASHAIGKKTKVIEAKGRYLVPGLLDGHMHVESGMVTVTEFVRTVAVRGTTGMFIDPHEIANIFGLKGVKLMVDEAQKQPIHVWVQMPSCVPSSRALKPRAHRSAQRKLQRQCNGKALSASVR